jgi:MFS family permease
MLPNVAAAGVSRKTHRLAVSVLFFLMGLCFASWASRIPSIQAQLGFSEAVLGLVLFAIPAGQILSLPLSGWLVAREGSRRMVAAGAVLYCGALLGLGWAASLYQLLPCLFLFGIGSNLLNIAINTQAVGVEKLYPHKPIMAAFHGMWSLAGFLGAAIGTLMIGLGVAPLYHFLLIGLLFLVGIAVSFGFDPDHPPGPSRPRQPVAALRWRARPGNPRELPVHREDHPLRPRAHPRTRGACARHRRPRLLRSLRQDRRRPAGKFTRARVLNEVGVQTPVFVRFSTVIGAKDSPETARDPRGFAVKLKTWPATGTWSATT